MSMEMCSECDSHVDTDYNVEGVYKDGKFICEDCKEEDDDNI